MAAEKVTIMVLKVDLQCSCCYKKVKKTLCKFPQIRDQVYDEKANTVTISVICCCSPEKIRDKLYCKGGKTIKDIHIKQPDNKKKEADKPKESEKPKNPEKPKEASEKPKSDGKGDKPKSNGADKPKEAAKVAEPAAMKPVPIGVPSAFPYSYDGYNAGGPYYYGAPPPPQPCYEGYGRGGHVSRYDSYFSEENPQGCSIM